MTAQGVEGAEGTRGAAQENTMILITGGLGFLGGNLAKHLLDLGQEVLLTRNRSAQIPTLLAPYVGRGLEVAPVDVASISTILDAVQRYGVSSIVHGAAIYEGRGSLHQAVDVNVMGTANILEAARLSKVGRVTFLSSEGVCQGHEGAKALKEEEFVWIRSSRYIPATKKMAEMLFPIYRREYGLDLVIARPSRVYGPLYTAGKNPILRMVTAAVEGAKTSFPDVDPNEGHDFVYVRDCARALAMVHLAEKPRHDLYNIGLGRFHTFGDVARILEELQPTVRIELGRNATPGKTEFDSVAWVDCSRIRDEFGYTPEYDLKRGISALASWVRNGAYV